MMRKETIHFEEHECATIEDIFVKYGGMGNFKLVLIMIHLKIFVSKSRNENSPLPIEIQWEKVWQKT